MKKNVILIVLDSITNDVLFNKNSSKLCAPFLNNLRNKSISGDKMFSEAPYTEAALMALLGSLDTMDKGGYMEKFKNKTCVLECFKKNGYKVFFNNYYPSVYPSYSVKGFDDKKYIEGFDFNQLWEYRLKYFSSIDISKEERKRLIEMLEDNLLAWLEYFDKIKNNNEETSMMNDCIDKSNLDFNIKLLKKEFCNFKNDKEQYLDCLFTMREKHPLFKIKTYKMTDKVHDDAIRHLVMKRYLKTFKKIERLNFNKNILNNKFPFSKFFKSLANKEWSVAKGLLAAYKNSLFDKDLYDRINFDYDQFKNQRSFYTVSQELCKWISNNKNKPFMAYVHVDDAHYTENFFTYDTNDIKIIDNDFKRIDDYLNKLPKKYYGSIAYDLALLYCDNVIKNIFKYLKDNNLLESTSVVITADHGFSYYFNPIREKYVISSYKENFNVPFIIYDKDIKPRKIYDFCSTKDIPTTLLSLANIKIPNDFKGLNLLKDKGRSYALLEYMGGGCPDIYRRPINLGVRTNNYFVRLDAFINKDFNENKIIEVYDLIHDPFENNNLCNKKNVNINKELEILEKRFDDIKKQYGGINENKS